ncbi:MAG: M28 family peptidase [Acidobacteriia bacterium]|nr:M28 family peptidase [Terriglobia bacterium]
MYSRPKFILPFLILFVAAGAAAQQIEFKTLDPSVVESRLRAVPKRDSQREPRLKELLLEAGCRSESYVKRLTPEQLANIQAMINIDSVGMTSTKIWASHSDAKLVEVLQQVATSMRLPFAGVNVDQVGTADSESFAKHKVPVITFHSATQQNFRVLHTTKDNMSAISLPDYYSTYKLLTGYLAACDVMLPPTSPASGTKKQ